MTSVSYSASYSAHKLYIVGIGLDGLAGLTPLARERVEAAGAIALAASYVPWVAHLPAEKLVMGSDLGAWIETLKQRVQRESVVVLASGDPLFFGIGRLLGEHFDRRQLTFYPHVSSVQLAFSRLGIPWQSATIVSVHGRSLEPLEQALKQCLSPIAVLTDGENTPGAIAQLIRDLHLPLSYTLWVCSQLGGTEERVAAYTLEEAIGATFPVPNVAILEATPPPVPVDLPLFGIPDSAFHTFPDRPGLIAKQEIRILTLGLLHLRPGMTVWDIGAGTGSISVEIGRLVPDARIYAIEQKAAGVALIRHNCDRFAVTNVAIVQGSAPAVLHPLPAPDRIFIGGGGKSLPDILATCVAAMNPKGVLVANFATLEHCTLALQLLRQHGWQVYLRQVNIARSTDIAGATRFAPLNPVTILQAIAGE